MLRISITLNFYLINCEKTTFESKNTYNLEVVKVQIFSLS